MFIFHVQGSVNMACQRRRVENSNNISSDEKLYLLCISSLSEDLRPSGAEVQLQTTLERKSSCFSDNGRRITDIKCLISSTNLQNTLTGRITGLGRRQGKKKTLTQQAAKDAWKHIRKLK